MKLTTNLLLIFCLLVSPVYAGENNHPKPPPESVNVPDNDSDTAKHLFIFSAIVFGVWCVAEKCWKSESIKTADTTITTEIPRNEYTYTIKP